LGCKSCIRHFLYDFWDSLWKLSYEFDWFGYRHKNDENVCWYEFKPIAKEKSILCKMVTLNQRNARDFFDREFYSLQKLSYAFEWSESPIPLKITSNEKKMLVQSNLIQLQKKNRFHEKWLRFIKKTNGTFSVENSILYKNGSMHLSDPSKRYP